MARARFRIVPYRMRPFIDWPLIVLTLVLLVLGIFTMWGAMRGGEEAALWPIPFYPRRQILYGVVGIAVMFGLIVLDYRRLAGWVWIMYGGLLLALAGLLVRNVAVKGAASWYDLGVFRLQPSEPGKIIIVLALARWLSLRMPGFKGLRHVWGPALIGGVPAALILAQRDLGTAMVLVPVTAAMCWVAGLRKWVFLLFIGLAVAGVIAGYPHLKPYQQDRIAVFLHPEQDLRGSGWNVFQAKTTLGSGEMLGKGWGRGTQTQFRFLPEFHTDFIFPTVGEQFGFAGCMAVIGLFAALLWRMVFLAWRTPDLFGVLIITGLTAMLVTHVIQNVGMVIGLLPITGLPLPYFSYGGSFMLTCMAAIGLTVGIGARRGLHPIDDE